MIVTEYSKRDVLRGIDRAGSLGLDIAIDTETTGLDLYLGDSVLGISFTYRYDDERVVSGFWPVAYQDGAVDPGDLIAALNNYGGTQIYHNAIFDWTGLAKLCPEFIIPERSYYDTAVAAWLYNENDSRRLKDLSDKYLGGNSSAEQKTLKALMKGRTSADIYKELRGMDEWKARPAKEAREEARRLSDESKKGWGDLTCADIAEYAIKDTYLTLALRDYQKRWSIDDALMREQQVQVLLYRMSKTGVRVDTTTAYEQMQDAIARMDIISLGFDGVNLSSPKQLSELIYDKWNVTPLRMTKGGKPSTDRQTLEQLDGHPKVRDILEYRRLQKAVSTYYRPLIDGVADDGRVHPVFSGVSTVTGRLSCSKPNMMTIPRDDVISGVRSLIIPEDGYELWEHDIVSAELFFQAEYSSDPTLLSALRNGDDLHAITAEAVFGPNFTGLQRRVAKNINYGFPYGAGANTVASYLVAGTNEVVTRCNFWVQRALLGESSERRCRKCHVCQADDILSKFRLAYPRLVRLMKGLSDIAQRDKVLPLAPPGRFRHFTGQRIAPYYTALNAIVQGGVAEFMKDVMIGIDAPIRELGGKLCLQVHDSLVTEMPIGTTKAFIEVLHNVSETVDPLVQLAIKWESSPWDAHE